MLSVRERKALTALHHRKGRSAQRRFLVEGSKAVAELLQSPWPVECILATEAWDPGEAPSVPVHRVLPEMIARVSAMEHAPPVLAVARIPERSAPPPPHGLVLALDGVQDPGNLGTLLRIADWFGLSHVLCSPDCVDTYNPKTVQASMGSLFRVPVFICDLSPTLNALPITCWRGAACLDGTNAYEASLPRDGVLVLGNEGHGIRPELLRQLPNRLRLPRLGAAESLNVAVAAALLSAEWRRQDLVAQVGENV